MKLNKIFSVLPFLLICTQLLAQHGEGKRATIMVVPWTSQEENIVEKIDADFNYRAVVNEIRRAFDLKGFTTIDFMERLSNVNVNNQLGRENWRDVFKTIVENSPADIFVEAEINILEGQRYGNKLNILLDAKDKFTSQSLANSGVLASPMVDTQDYAMLVKKALEKDQALDDFLVLMGEKFSKIRISGRPITLRVEVHQECEYDLHSEIGDDYDLLQDKIIDWVKEKSTSWNTEGLIENGGYHVAAQVPSLLEFDLIEIPLKNKDGDRYDANAFSREARKAIMRLGKESEKAGVFKVRPTIRGNSIILVIME